MENYSPTQQLPPTEEDKIGAQYASTALLSGSKVTMTSPPSWSLLDPRGAEIRDLSSTETDRMSPILDCFSSRDEEATKTFARDFVIRHQETGKPVSPWVNAFSPDTFIVSRMRLERVHDYVNGELAEIVRALNWVSRETWTGTPSRLVSMETSQWEWEEYCREGVGISNNVLRGRTTARSFADFCLYWLADYVEPHSSVIGPTHREVLLFSKKELSERHLKPSIAPLEWCVGLPEERVIVSDLAPDEIQTALKGRHYIDDDLPDDTPFKRIAIPRTLSALPERYRKERFDGGEVLRVLQRNHWGSMEMPEQFSVALRSLHYLYDQIVEAVEGA